MIDYHIDDINNCWIMAMIHNSRTNAMHGQTQDQSWRLSMRVGRRDMKKGKLGHEDKDEETPWLS